VTNSLRRLSLKNKKNLLAFSAGIDSSALFFLLRDAQIPFDIALVNYGTRTQSDVEEAHAHALASQYGMQCFTKKAPAFEKNFEKNARDFRYDFFEKIITEQDYETLLTAHQLNDRLEWFLMRLSRGAGLSELTGMETIERRSGYTLVRPLLAFPKSELLDYLKKHHCPYFVDESNHDEQYERNRFRKHFSDPLITQFGEGIARSFDYLMSDRAILEAGFETEFQINALRILRLDNPDLVPKAADVTLKKLGYLLSAAQRREIRENPSLVIGGQWAIERTPERLWIAPYLSTPMPKSFKEQCRTQQIPAKIRPYLYREGIDPEALPTV